MNRGSMPFESVMRKAISLGCEKAALVFSENGKASSIRFVSVDNGWEWEKGSFIVKRHSQKSVKRKGGAISSNSRKLKAAFGIADSAFGAERDLSYSNKKLSVKEGNKEVFWVEGSFSKR
jgi:hypothetical protein